GDACDLDDAPVELTRAGVKASTGATDANGGVLVRGRLSVPPPDAFGGSAGVSIHVTDGGTLDTTVVFAAAECATSASGRVRCRRADDPSTQAKFRPRRATPTLFK